MANKVVTGREHYYPKKVGWESKRLETVAAADDIV